MAHSDGPLVEGLAALHGKIICTQVEPDTLRIYSTEKNQQMQVVENELTALKNEEAQMRSRSPESKTLGPNRGDLQNSGQEDLF